MTKKLLTLVAVLACGVTLIAGGFAVQENSAKGMGKAFAGAATGLGDASSAFYNPAAMSRLGKTTVTVGIHNISPKGEFSNEASIYNPAVGGQPLDGGNGGNSGGSALVPNIYLARELTEGMHLGLAINAPFGLESEYPDGWVGRYHAIRSDLQVINFNLDLSYEVNDMFAIGIGASYYDADAELSNAIDFGTIALGIVGPGVGFAPGQNDGFFLVQGDDTSSGYNGGLLLTPNDDWTFGLGYRSKVDIDIQGDAFFGIPEEFESISAQTGLFTNTTGTASVELPSILTFGFEHRVDENWGYSFDYHRYEWSTFDELRIEFDNPAQPDAVVDESWVNTDRFALGFEFAANDSWDYRFGFAYEETPIPDPEHRTPRIPDNDRTWISGGLSYAPRSDFAVDFGFSYLIMDDGEVASESTTGDMLVGAYDLNVIIVSLQGTWKP